MRAPIPGTRPLDPRQAFDAERLREWLHAHVSEAHRPLTIGQFDLGQSNPTYLIDADGRQLVLRRKPSGKLLPSAHAVEREFRIMTALAATDVPVPRCLALCEDAAVIGSVFYVMEYVPGRIFNDATLPELAHTERAAVYAEMNRVIAALHALEPNALGLADYGRAGGYIERQVQRWTQQYRASQTEHIEAMERLIAWLPHNIPPGAETRIVHGDYRLDNLIFDARVPRIVAVLDWELSTLGDPLADFAYHCLTWYRAPETRQGLEGVPLGALGLPDVGRYLADYCARRHRELVPPRHWEFYIVFNMFRLVGILQGIAARALQGNASSTSAAAMGRGAAPLAQAAWQRVEALEARPGAAPAV